MVGSGVVVVRVLYCILAVVAPIIVAGRREVCQVTQLDHSVPNGISKFSTIQGRKQGYHNFGEFKSIVV